MKFDIDRFEAATPLQLALRLPGKVADVLDVCRRAYSTPALCVGDVLTRRWLAKTNVPYTDELDILAKTVRGPGVHALNLSYEWGCTTGVAHGPDSRPVLFRTLDWPIKGLGKQVVCAMHTGPAGEYQSLTYPGFLGAHTVLAPGRFAVAINQAPLPHRGLGLLGDWLASRLRTGRLPHIPATFLLRQACETCADFRQAVDMLRSTPLCIPAIFIVAGTEPGQAAVIERDYERAVLAEGPPVAANHWRAAPWRGRPRPTASAERAQAMEDVLPHADLNFGWLTPPLMNKDTRLAMEARPALGSMRALAVEGNEALSHVLDV